MEMPMACLAFHRPFVMPSVILFVKFHQMDGFPVFNSRKKIQTTGIPSCEKAVVEVNEKATSKN